MKPSVYIHIPFCNQICTYCDFCKLYKQDKWVDNYLKVLENEIKESYKGEEVKTLYIGGGTPTSLNLEQLTKLFDILRVFKTSKQTEITIECNVEDLTEEKLEFLQDKVNRLSVGVQSFNREILNLLGRKPVETNKIKLAKQYFENINIDLMYGFKEQTLEDLKKDVEKILNLDIPHISAYNLILEPHTKLYIDGYEPEAEDTTKDEYLNQALTNHGYIHYEISNYAKKGYESKHNLVYWNNAEYYGFGLGASGYKNHIRYENTRNLQKYLNKEYLNDKHKLDINEKVQNEFILGLRKLKGIDKKNFKKKYHFDATEIKEVKDLIDKGLLIEDTNIYINPKYIYLSNEILINFLDINLHKH